MRWRYQGQTIQCRHMETNMYCNISPNNSHWWTFLFVCFLCYNRRHLVQTYAVTFVHWWDHIYYRIPRRHSCVKTNILCRWNLTHTKIAIFLLRVPMPLSKYVINHKISFQVCRVPRQSDLLPCNQHVHV